MSTVAKPQPAAVTTAYSALVTPRWVRSRALGDLVMGDLLGRPTGVGELS
jgi:hypothetical protein